MEEGQGDLNLKQVIPLGLGVARITVLERVTMILFSTMVLSNMSLGRKEGEIDYQRENVDKTPQVAVTVFHRRGQAGILLWCFSTRIINPREADAGYLVNVQ